jgi:iron complex outermembrane receptor protein
MFFQKDTFFCAAKSVLVLLLMLVIGVALLPAQTRQLLSWQEDLNFLQNASDEELTINRAAVVQIRRGVDLWIKLHPGTKIALGAAPEEPWETSTIRSQVSALRQAVNTILKEESGRPFELGSTVVSVTAEASPLSPVADTFDSDEIVNRQAVNVAEALDYIPGVAIEHGTANRNEALIRLRGFSSKGQVSLYLDGIPVTMPYDGSIDFNRFLSNDFAEIQVAKGFSSPLLGPNAMGGSINLVTKQPEKKLNVEALIGTGSGESLLSSLNIGSRWQDFYLQGSMDWYQRDFMPISGDFPTNDFQPNYERKQSDFRDAKYNGRIAFTPRENDQYVFSYMDQKGEKGVPLYAGANEDARFSRYAYRRWPYWNKTGYYLITSTEISESNTLKLRGYYDQFRNTMNFYDDDNYSSMDKSHTNSSEYDDHAAGAAAEFTSRYVPRNVMSASFVFRDNIHKETLIYPAQSPYPFITPTLLDRDQTYSMGFQDVITISSRLRATFGFSADYLKGLQVQQRTNDEKGFLPITCPSDPNNTSFSGCTAHVWNYNPQASLSFSATPLDTIYVTFADRGRFPLLKESYSYKLGRGIPNPDLKPEKNTSWNIGYTRTFPAKTVLQIEYFHNHLRDAIESVYVVDPGNFCDGNTGALAGYCSQNVNVANENHQGFEVSIRSTPISRVVLDLHYSYIERTIDYDFGDNIDINKILTSVQILPTLPRNKFIANATVRLPRDILATANVRYEGGITLQDNTYDYAPENLPYGSSYATMDLGTIVPIHSGVSVQAGIKNLFDENYYYDPGFPEPGRNMFINFRYRF